MDCKETAQRLSAYIDNEVPAQERELIAGHLKTCPACARELKALAGNDAFMKNAPGVTVSPDFRARFWQRVRNDEQRRGTFLDKVILRWIPVPVACAALIVAFSGFSMLSPVLYALPEGTAASARIAADTFAGYCGKYILAPLNFADFCDCCYNEVCASCRLDANKECGECDMKGVKK